MIATAEEPSGEPQRTSLRVLVIDDDMPVADILCMMLRASGHRAQKAVSLAEVELVLRRRVYDVVVVDYEMPQIKPNDVISLLRTRAPSAVIVGHSGSDRRREFESLGVPLFLGKPWNPTHLVELLDTR